MGCNWGTNEEGIELTREILMMNSVLLNVMSFKMESISRHSVLTVLRVWIISLGLKMGPRGDLHNSGAPRSVQGYLVRKLLQTRRQRMAGIQYQKNP